MPSGCSRDAGCACSAALSLIPRTGTKPARSQSPIGFVTARVVSGKLHDAVGKGAGELLSVYVPTTPNPTSGFYLLVDKTLVRDLDMPVQQAFKQVITMGVAKDPDLLTTTAKLTRDSLKSTKN